MAGKTNYLEGQFLNLLLRTQVAWKPAGIWVGLFTAAPTDAGGGTEVTIGSNAYGRAAVTQADASWNAPAGTPRATTNAIAINFATPTPAGWGLVTHFGLFDAVSAGNLLYWAALGTSKTINANDTVSFGIGTLSITED
jgi:hypothetical protein